MTFSLQVNEQPYTVDAHPDTPLLRVLRDVIGLTGTKFGCGIAQCGADDALRRFGNKLPTVTPDRVAKARREGK